MAGQSDCFSLRSTDTTRGQRPCLASLPHIALQFYIQGPSLDSELPQGWERPRARARFRGGNHLRLSTGGPPRDLPAQDSGPQDRSWKVRSLTFLPWSSDSSLLFLQGACRQVRLWLAVLCALGAWPRGMPTPPPKQRTQKSGSPGKLSKLSGSLWWALSIHLRGQTPGGDVREHKGSKLEIQTLTQVQGDHGHLDTPPGHFLKRYIKLSFILIAEFGAPLSISCLALAPRGSVIFL